jgi:DNA phosphorothioation-dependent restriction protein DptG
MSDPSNNEIMEAIKGLASKVDSNIEAVQTLAEHMDEQHAQTRSELRSEIGSLRSETAQWQDSLKKELSDFRYSTEEGFNSVEHMIREEDKKIDRLTEKLLIKKVINEKDTKELLGLGPFPLQGAADEHVSA